MRIDPHLAHIGGDPGERLSADIYGRKLFPGQILHDGDGRPARCLFEIPGQASLAGVIQGHELRQGLDRLIGFIRVVPGHHQPEVWPVGG